MQPGRIEMYKLYFRKEKMIHQNLNKCLLHDNFIDGEVWILEKDFNKLKDLLKEINKDDSRIPASFIDLEEANLLKPTYIQSNEMIWPFQEIVNTYGVPRYMEINPTYFNIVTFPFLFGVMFGDIGHGLILFIFAIYLCINSEKIKKDPKSYLKIVLSARYLLLMMGFFAFYCGWIYNDFISLPLPVFGTCYEDKVIKKQNIAKRIFKECVYPFGLDPKWKVATNELAFVNSFKMKMSVILGVSHMLLGIVMKGLNNVYFNNKIGFFFEFIPQLLFMGLLFGYMNVMIFIKWTTEYLDNKKSPSLIAQMMNIFLKMGSVVSFINK
jgi:V-type H+-transporting ATPase subunit a